MAADELTTKTRHSPSLLIPCLILALTTSLALNAIAGGGILHARRIKAGLPAATGGWSQEAAEEAERVAEIECSGHGVAFLDGAPAEGGAGTKCECYGCFAGPDCSRVESDGCVADADGGNPLFMEPFWRKHAASSAILISGWHRMGYSYNNGSLISLQLEKHVRRVHALAENAITKGKFIVFGSGSTELLNAAVHALSSVMHSNESSKASPVKVVAAFPYYQMYQQQTDYFKSDEFEFHGDASLWKNNSDMSDKFIEFVTSPNNPDCQLNMAVLQGPSVKTIHDYAYFWPHFTAIPSPADDDVMIFTLSKLTGHAGSRFGWAVIKDEKVYEKMMEYVRYNILVLSHETQLRALKLLKVVLEEGNGREIFEFAHDKMSERWQTLSRVLSKTRHYSLQHIPPLFCTFFQRVREASPAYAWLRCNREEDTDCHAVLKSAGIIGRAGNVFGGGDRGNRYVRLTLLKTQDDFDLLISHIENLVSTSADKGDSKTM